MNERPFPPADSSEEISALIKTLLAAEQRLVELTAGRGARSCRRLANPARVQHGLRVAERSDDALDGPR